MKMASAADTPDDAAKFLREAAVYFERRPTGGEDMAFWSNYANAKNCIEIADMIERLVHEAKTLRSQDWDALKAHQQHMDKLPLAKRPVAFRVKDFADGWIIFQDEKRANDEADKTGALMQGLYVRDGQ